MQRTNEAGFARMDELGKCRTPFLFVISYDRSKVFVRPLDKLDNDIFYKLDTLRNYPLVKRDKPYAFTKQPVPFSVYKQAIEAVKEEIRNGNTYLLNLTFRTPIDTDLSLQDIFWFAKAKYKLYFKGKFVCFSPERFVTIEDNTIATFPMKGTIDAHIPDAKAMILADEKETAEHVMIVDLMRNDLGMVGSNVRVKRFRYVDRIQAGDKELLQVSSEITAELPDEWHARIGTILKRITPAGSITGTPKKKTVEIIDRIEDYDRGYYTGVFGVYDGKSLRSAVMIRFIEREEGRLYYKSGGGITIDSDARSEYDELVDKIYVPL